MSDPTSPANPIQVRFQRQSDGSLEVYANIGRGWQHYSSLPVHFRVPDGSPKLNTPGYRTMMHLRNKFGAELLPTFEGSYNEQDVLVKKTEGSAWPPTLTNILHMNTFRRICKQLASRWLN